MLLVPFSRAHRHPSALDVLSMFGVYALSAPLLWAGRRLRRAVRGAPTAGA